MIRRKILHRRLTEKNHFFFISFGLVHGKELYILFFQLIKLLMYKTSLLWFLQWMGNEVKKDRITLFSFFRTFQIAIVSLHYVKFPFLLKWLFLVSTALYWSHNVLQKETCFYFVSRSSMDSLSVAIVLASEVASSEFELVDGFLWAAFLLLSSSVSMKRKSLFLPALMHVTSFMHE